MKKQFLIGISTVVFTLLFYNQDLGLNIAIFALLLLGLTWYKFPEIQSSTKGKFLIVSVLCTALSFAWLADFSSFIALLSSLVLLRMYAVDPELKWVFGLPFFLINFFSGGVRFIFRSRWIEGVAKTKNQYGIKILMYGILPLLFLSGFVFIYVINSEYLSDFVGSIHLDFNFVVLMITIVFGVVISFTYWDCWILDAIKKYNLRLRNTFSPEESGVVKSSFGEMNIDLERRSGEITLLLLNLFLLVFLAFYNYEQFFDSSVVGNLSEQTHQGVNSLILSIVMAIGLLLFYFKGSFNFDKKAKRLKFLALSWIVLNLILIGSTCIQNIEYVLELGLTYKRLGVFMFLGLSVLGLFFTARKIQLQKTNFYLIDRMSVVVFCSLIICGIFNWGGLITRYNLSQEKIDWNYLSGIESGNEHLLLEYALKNSDADTSYRQAVYQLKNKIVWQKSDDLLSSSLYYKFIKLPETPFDKANPEEQESFMNENIVKEAISE